MQSAPKFFSGLSGVVLPLPRYQFPLEYQGTSRLTYYSTLFNTIEVNSSFYKIPMKRTVSRWCSTVNEPFKFTFKLFKEVTHIKNLNFDPVLLNQFFEAISPTGTKRGCLLVQFPPSLNSQNIYGLDNLLQSVKVADHENLWDLAVEFRHASWYNEDVYDLLESFNSSLVIQDIPKSRTPLINLPSDVVYVRFHGPTGNYGGSYTDDFLFEYAEYIKEWLREEKTVYVYFNNTRGNAFNNLVTLNSYVSQGLHY